MRGTDEREAEGRAPDAEAEALLAAGRLRELSLLLDSPEPNSPELNSPELEGPEAAPQGPTSWRRRMRAELAVRDRGPLTDAILWARDAPLAEHPALALATIRRLARLSAKEGTRALLARAEREGIQGPAIEALKAQIEAGMLRAEGPATWAAELALRAGRLEEAEEALREEPSSEGREWRASLALARADFEGALVALLDRWADARESDEEPRLRLRAAFAAWAAGREDAVETLRDLRGAPDAPDRAPHEREAGELLEAIERSPEPQAGPAWRLGELDPDPRPFDGQSSIAQVSGWLTARLGLPAPLAAAHTAELRAALREAGVETLRVVLRGEVLDAALELGAIPLLEEERPTETGLLGALGRERRSGLLLLRDPGRVGAFLRTGAEQARRSELLGGGGLLVLGRGEEAARRREALCARGVEEDEALVSLDQCVIGPDGQPPPRARAAELAAQVREQRPELPLGYLYEGEALIEQIRLGRAKMEPGSSFSRWLAQTHERFERAEWAAQIHARALGLDRRPHESGIAWGDAARLDPEDERNFFGMAEVDLRLGHVGPAESAYRRALTLRPSHLGALIGLTECAIRTGRYAEAEAWASFALELDPQQVGALTRLAYLHEREEAWQPAKELLAEAAEIEGPAGAAQEYLCARLLYDGLKEEAGGEIARWREASGSPRAWRMQAWLAWSQADADEATRLLREGLSRCGPERDLCLRYAQIVHDLHGDSGSLCSALDPLLAALRPRPADYFDALLRVAPGHPELAVELGARFVESAGPDANPPWRLAQLCLAHAKEAEADRIRALLETTVERAGTFAHARAVRAWLCLEDDPEAALAILDGADPRSAPGLIWPARAAALERLGRTEQARATLERMSELYPHGLEPTITFLQSIGFFEIAKELLEALLEAHPEEPRGRYLLGSCHVALGEAERALAAFGVEEGEALIASPALLRAGLRAGRSRAVSGWAEASARLIRRDSGYFEDPWPYEAWRAAACEALGDSGPREELLSRWGSHPEVLAILAEADQRLGLARSPAREALEHRAPGRLRQLEREARR